MNPKTRSPLAAGLVVAVLSCLAFAGCYYSADHSHTPGGSRLSRPCCPPGSPHCPEPHNHNRRPFRFGIFDRESRNDEVKEQYAGPVDPQRIAGEAKEGRFFRRPGPRYTNPVYIVPSYPSTCLNCPQVSPGHVAPSVSPYYRPAPEQPRLPSFTPRAPDFSRAPRGEVKTGGFACSNCGRITVGDQWATEWIDGEPVTFCCRACWETMSPIERRACFENWTRRQAGSGRPGFGAPAGNYPRK